MAVVLRLWAAAALIAISAGCGAGSTKSKDGAVSPDGRDASPAESGSVDMLEEGPADSGDRPIETDGPADTIDTIDFAADATDGPADAGDAPADAVAVADRCVATDVGESCGHCGGKIGCDGACTITDPPGYGTPCNGCRGTIACNGLCPRPVGSFGPVTPLVEFNTTESEEGLSISSNGLEAYFTSTRPGGMGGIDLWFSARSAPTVPWQPPTPLASLNTMVSERRPRLSPDGLLLYHSRETSTGTYDIYLATRTTSGAAFGLSQPVPSLNSASNESSPFPTSDERTLYLESDRPGGPGGWDLFVSTALAAGGFTTPERVPELNSPMDDGSPKLTGDALTIYMDSNRTGGQGYDIWTAERSSPSGPFGPVQNVAGLNSAGIDYPVHVSPDGCTLYFASSRAGGLGGYDLYQATRSPQP